MPLFRQLPDRIRLTLWFTAIAAVIGGAYAHFISMQNGAPLFGFAGVMRGILTGAVMASGRHRRNLDRDAGVGRTAAQRLLGGASDDQDGDPAGRDSVRSCAGRLAVPDAG